MDTRGYTSHGIRSRNWTGERELGRREGGRRERGDGRMELRKDGRGRGK
jgi:hypothetical protein